MGWEGRRVFAAIFGCFAEAFRFFPCVDFVAANEACFFFFDGGVAVMEEDACVFEGGGSFGACKFSRGACSIEVFCAMKGCSRGGRLECLEMSFVGSRFTFEVSGILFLTDLFSFLGGLLVIEGYFCLLLRGERGRGVVVVHTSGVGEAIAHGGIWMECVGRKEDEPREDEECEESYGGEAVGFGGCRVTGGME